jgi:tRNA A-37 threonylcarbamoyl transferase component Bud32
VLSNRYHLVESLGEGAMGSVWKAYDTRLERTVAVKELISGRMSGDDLKVRRERVQREAQALALVEHPAIVSIHDLIFEGRDRDPWIVMAYVRGRSLKWIIEKNPPLEEQQVARIGLAALHGLRACHERDVYHRDVKPANIVRGDNGAVCLVDFGIAQILGKKPLTDDSQVIGTPEFMAPELVDGKEADQATDLWSLAVTLYYALEGGSPFRAETLTATFAAILSKTPPLPRTAGPLAGLVLSMLAKEPKNRPGADRVAGELRRVATGEAAARPQRSARARIAEQPRDTGNGLMRGPDQSPVRPATAQLSPSRRQAPVRTGAIRALPPAQRLTPLSGWPVKDAAKIVSEWPTDRAAADLLALDQTRAANIIVQCPDPVAGKLLSAIAMSKPSLAWKLLTMISPSRAGWLLDNMSSLGAAAALDVPSAIEALGLLDRADERTVADALSEMQSAKAARIVLAMADERRAAHLLHQTANPATVAGILRFVVPQVRNGILGKLPADFRALVVQYLQRTDGPPGA